MRRLIVRAAAVPTALANEQLTVDPAQQPGGFSQHPAVLDAATHTAALFAAADDTSGPAVTRVPAALDAYRGLTAPQQQSQQQWRGWCVGSLQAVLPSRTVVTSFGLACNEDAAIAGAHLCGFQAKVMGPARIDATLPAEAPLQYCIEWQAQQAAECGDVRNHAGLAPCCGVQWVKTGSEAAATQIHRMPMATGGASWPAHDAAHSLALLQTVVREASPGAALQLVTRGALSFPEVFEAPGGRRVPSTLSSQWPTEFSCNKHHTSMSMPCTASNTPCKMLLQQS